MLERSALSFASRTLREPTVHFALIAAALFVLAGLAKSFNRPVVEIDRRSVEFRIRELERARGTSLNEAERRLAEAAYVNEQILAHEARIRGYDDDEKIRAILSQKMLHILSGDVPQPTDAELRAYFDANRGRYAGRPMVTVEDCFVAGNVRSAERNARFDPDSVKPAGRLSRTTMTRVTAGELTWSYGEDTAAMIFGAGTGTWVGPHRSADGEHWFRILDRIERTDAPPLDGIREQVRYDWMAQKEEALLKQRVGDLRQQYSVRYAGGSAP